VLEKVLNRDILIKFISTHYQLADIFTKSLSSARFLLLQSKLMVMSSPISLRGAVREASIDSSIDHANANDTTCDQGITINAADHDLTTACAATYTRKASHVQGNPALIQGMTKSCTSVRRKVPLNDPTHQALHTLQRIQSST
jgi:hypothetical protein